MAETRLETFTVMSQDISELSEKIDYEIKEFLNSNRYGLVNIIYDSPIEIIDNYKMVAHLFYEVSDEQLELEKQQRKVYKATKLYLEYSKRLNEKGKDGTPISDDEFKTFSNLSRSYYNEMMNLIIKRKDIYE